MTKKKKQQEPEDPHAVERAALKVQFERELQSYLGHIRTILRMAIHEGLAVTLTMKSDVTGPQTKIDIKDLE